MNELKTKKVLIYTSINKLCIYMHIHIYSYECEYEYIWLYIHIYSSNGILYNNASEGCSNTWYIDGSQKHNVEPDVCTQWLCSHTVQTWPH